MQKLIPALLLTLLALASCTKSDDQAKILNDTWAVSLYEVPQANVVVPQDKTSDFAGYTFEFNDDDKFVINKPDGSNVEAKWKVEATTASFGMDPAFAPVEEIMGEWELIEQTDTKLELKRIDPSSTSVNAIIKLTFQKQ